MALDDWTLGGLKSRAWHRLQNNPKYTTALRELAARKAVIRLLVSTRNVQTFYNTDTEVLTAGEYAGKYAQEYPLPDRTLVVDTLSFDGQKPLRLLSEYEYASTGMDANTGTDDPYAAYYYNTPEGGTVAVLVPRPNRTARIRFMGVVEPNWMVNGDDSVPPFTRDADDALLAYMVQYLTEGQAGEMERNLAAEKKWKSERAEFKVNQGVNRVFKTKRERDIIW